MMLTTVTYYVIERDEDERYNREFNMLVSKAMSWHPELYALNEDDSTRGASALKSLAKGEAVSPHRMAFAIAYLRDAIAFYENNPWGGLEPYDGRNRHAAADLRNVLVEIDVTVEVPA